LRDLIESGVVPVVQLTEVFRQAASSKVITNAHLIRQGQMPELRTADSDSDFYFVERDTPEEIAATLLKLIQDRIPTRLRLDPIRDIQVLCPMNRGSIGVRELNTALQAALNPARPGESVAERLAGGSGFGTRSSKSKMIIKRRSSMETLAPSKGSIPWNKNSRSGSTTGW
jgi:exodeoxyribonuclease V alpha subunit